MSITPRINFATELTSLFDLRGKTAYVPGGYGGIGEAIAWGLALAGARVAISGRDETAAVAMAADLRAAGCDALGLPMDAHSVPQMQDSEAADARHFGKLDILGNCVGMQRGQAVLEVAEGAFDEVLHALPESGGNPSFGAISPNARVPALELDGAVIAESLAICEWAAEQ